MRVTFFMKAMIQEKLRDGKAVSTIGPNDVAGA
jgi:hypothetical protein